MNIQQKRDFLINAAYWLLIALAVYLGFAYLLPISVPFILGILLARFVVLLSDKIHCRHRLFRILLTLVLYGILGLGISLLIADGMQTISRIVKWLPELYEMKLLPIATMAYDWIVQTIAHLDPEIIGALNSSLSMLLESVLSGLKNLITYLSGFAVNLVSGLVTGVPNLVLSLLAMIFSTIFVVVDYEQIVGFYRENTPQRIKKVLDDIRYYLTNTLFVVIRSYALIMLLTFTELSILFSVFGVEFPILKAGVIALLDIMPILGTGGIMIPWAITSLVLGYTKLGIQLFIIYAIVTVVRNYVEPKIVGTQLGLHPIITLVAMFIGLRLFGFWGLFGLPVGISYLWKKKNDAVST